MKSTKTNLTENEIRPDKLVAGQRRAFFNDIKRLLRARASFVFIACPACATKKSHRAFNKNGFNYVRCDNCATLYLNPRPTPAILEKFYAASENYAYWNKYIFPTTEQTRREKIFVPRVDLVIKLTRQFKVATESLLEVGSGFGTFGEEMINRRVFKKVVAIEPSPDLAASCRQRGIEIIQLPIEKVSFDQKQKFDVVVSFEVIEHLFAPRDFLQSCQKLLRPGGLLILSCPNSQGFDFVMLGKQCNSIDHEHLNYFNPTSLGYLCENSRLKVIKQLTPGKLDAEIVRKKILNGEFKVDAGSFWHQVLIERWDQLGADFQKFLALHQLSSHLVICARNNQ